MGVVIEKHSQGAKRESIDLTKYYKYQYKFKAKIVTKLKPKGN